MAKVLKVMGALLALVIVVLLVAPFALVGRVEPIVKREVNRMIDATVEFDKLSLSLVRNFPYASLALEGVSIVGNEPFVGDTLMSADCIAASVDVMSLFGDEGFDVSRVELRRPRIFAMKNSDGAVNWNIVLMGDTQTEEDTTSSAFRLSLRDVRLTDGFVALIDDSSKMIAVADDINIALKGDMSADQTMLETRLGVGDVYLSKGGVTLLKRTSLSLDAKVDADLAESRFAFDKNTLSVNDIQLSFDGWVQLLDDAVDMDLSLATNRVDFKQLLSLVPAVYMHDFDELNASGVLVLNGWAKGRMEGDSYPSFALDATIEDGTFKYASLPKSVDDIVLKASLASAGGSLDNTVIDVPTLGFSIAGQSVAAKFHATKPLSDMVFNASVDGVLNLGAVREIYPLPDTISLGGVVTADVDVAARLSDIENERYEKVDARGRIAIEDAAVEIAELPLVKVSKAIAMVNPDALIVSEFNAFIGRSDLNAAGQLTGYLGYLLRGDCLSGGLRINSRLLDLNELMGGSVEESAEESSDSESDAMIAPKIPDNLDLSLVVDMGRIEYQKMVLENFTGKATMRGGELSMQKLNFDALGGKIAASASYANLMSEPAVKFDASVKSASFARTFNELEMVQKLVPLFEKTGGDYSMSLKLDTRLTESMDVQYPTLQATGEISSDNIELQNMEVFSMLAIALKNPSLGAIEARRMRVAFAVRDGRLVTKPFDIKLGAATLTLSGSTGLDQTIDYVADVSLPQGSVGGFIKRVPVEIGGTFAKPTIKLGVEQMVGDAVKQAALSGVKQLLGDKATVDGASSAMSQTLLDEAKAAGDKLIEAARKEGDKLVAKASTPLAKIAAQKSAELLVRAAEQQAAKLLQQAQSKLDASAR